MSSTKNSVHIYEFDFWTTLSLVFIVLFFLPLSLLGIAAAEVKIKPAVDNVLTIVGVVALVLCVIVLPNII